MQATALHAGAHKRHEVAADSGTAGQRPAYGELSAELPASLRIQAIAGWLSWRSSPFRSQYWQLLASYGNTGSLLSDEVA